MKKSSIFFCGLKKSLYICNVIKKTKNKMKKTVVTILLSVLTLNASAQVIKKDTILIGDSINFVKIQEGKKFFAIYKGKKIRCAKGDKGKRAFIIYNLNTEGERKVSKIYYAN